MNLVRKQIYGFVVTATIIAWVAVFTIDQKAIGQDVAQNCKPQDPSKPNIDITLVPPWDDGGPIKTKPIAGKVTGVDFKMYKVVLYAFAADNVYYVQPTKAAPKTPIDNRGNWKADIHLGHRYAALLVTSSFTPDAVADALPEPGNEVVARCEVAGTQ